MDRGTSYKRNEPHAKILPLQDCKNERAGSKMLSKIVKGADIVIIGLAVLICTVISIFIHGICLHCCCICWRLRTRFMHLGF